MPFTESLLALLALLVMVAALIVTGWVVEHDNYVPCHAASHQGWTAPDGCPQATR